MPIGLPEFSIVRNGTMNALFVQCFVAVDVGMHKTLAKKQLYGKENDPDCNY